MTIPDEISTHFRRRDYVKITIFGFALTALWQSLHTIILPLRLLDFIPETQKNTYLGLLTLSGLLLAFIAQPVAGTISDRSGFKMGRRRPYILIGGVIAMLLIPSIGLVGSYAAIFAVYCALQLASNTAQGPYQAFIPELVPANKRGMASGVKALFEICGGIILVYLSSVFMDRYSNGDGAQWLWLVLGILAVIMLSATAGTVVFVREPRIHSEKARESLLATLYRTLKNDIWKNRNFVWFLVSRMLVFMAFTTIQQFALYFIKDVIGVDDPAKATAVFSIVSVIGMLMVVWPAGYLSDRIGRKPLTIFSGLLGALGIAIIAFSQNYDTILWAAGILGISMGIFNSANWALATDFAPETDEARYLGLANMATAGGAVLARVIGPVIDIFNGVSLNFGYTVMLLFCLAYFIAGSLLVLRIKQRR
jgi:Na+/melibiose symporter-like transporter